MALIIGLLRAVCILLLLLMFQQSVGHLRVKDGLEIRGERFLCLVFKTATTLDKVLTVRVVVQHVQPLDEQVVARVRNAPGGELLQRTHHFEGATEVLDWGRGQFLMKLVGTQ